MSHSIQNFAFGLFCDYSKLIELYKISEVLFRLLGTNGSHVKAENERLLFVQIASKNCTQKRAARAARLFFLSSNQSNH